MKENEPQRPPLVRFLGGRTSIFVLSIVLLIGLIIMVFSQISFIFDPLNGFIGTVALPSYFINRRLLFIKSARQCIAAV